MLMKIFHEIGVYGEEEGTINIYMLIFFVAVTYISA